MATGKKGDGPEKPLQADRIMERLVGDSTQVTTGLTSYIGLLGRSPKDGYWRLYLSLDMSTSVELREEDIVHSEQLPPDKSPFGSLGGTQVFVKKDAKVTTTRTISRTHDAGGDEFDLDIRLGGGSGPIPLKCDGTVTTCIVFCIEIGGGGGGEDPGTKSCFKTCHNCTDDTCQTCLTKCGAATCNTCQTKCGQATCYQTCQTCYTKCVQHTCNTCVTKCETCALDTCGPVCQHVTNHQTCDCP